MRTQQHRTCPSAATTLAVNTAPEGVRTSTATRQKGVGTNASICASLSQTSKLAFEATASERAPRKAQAVAKQREEREWKSAMEARHGKATPENMCPRKCPKCAEANSWRLTFRGPFGPDMDMYADCQCSNPKCRHVWEAEA